MTANPEKPVIVVDSDDEGEKIPRLYKTPATITMTRMAQPYVIMYSNADWDFTDMVIIHTSDIYLFSGPANNVFQ